MKITYGYELSHPEIGTQLPPVLGRLSFEVEKALGYQNEVFWIRKEVAEDYGGSFTVFRLTEKRGLIRRRTHAKYYPNDSELVALTSAARDAIESIPELQKALAESHGKGKL